MASKLFDALFKQSAHIKKLADGNIEFALNLYQKIIQKDEEANTFLSPFSITVALAMIGAGAQSKTAEELINTLKLQSFEEDLKNLHSAFEDVLHSFGSDTTPIAFRFANGIFLQESYPILEDFRSILSRYYHAEVNPENFVLDHDTARKEINQWVEEKTLQKIKNLLPPEAVNRFTRLILISAVHFKGEWEVQFNPKRTSKGDFHRNSEDNVPASFMRIKKSFPYAEPPQLQCQVVELPYRGKRLGMIVLLPKNPEGLPELEKQLTAKQLKDIVSSLRTTEVWVVLPKFRLEIGTPLTEVLKKLGIQELFGEGRADLTGISTAGDLFVSDAIHKAYLEVNEEGTEAAAATAVVVNRLGMGRSIIPEFTANHPFLFLIYDKATEMILFMGRLTDPPQMVCSETELGRSNLIFSPFSITTALAMTWAGARNETARQIKEVLEFRLMDDNDHIIHQAFFDVLQDLQNGNASAANISILHSANRFYVDESYNILEDFSSIISKKYMTEVGRLDFSRDTEQARQDINEWVQQVTNGKVKELIPEDVLSATTRIVLVNAIYFKGTWSIRFDPEKIHRGHFYRKKFEKPITIAMMENRAVFPFAIDYDFKCKVVELPYTGKHYRMLIFLPFDVDGLAIFERKFTPGLVKFLKKSMAKTKVTVVIPQLKMSSSIPLSDSLMAMGIRDLFYHDKSDLSGIAGTTDLHYFDFVHNAFLDANEGGRIARAGLASKMAVSRHRSQELSFVADHPFIFLIYDKPSKMIFFIGRFSDPAPIALGPEMD